MTTSSLRQLPVSQVRDHLAEAVHEAEHAGVCTYITHRGRRAAAVIPADEAEQLDSAEDAYLVCLAENALASGETVSFSDVLAEIAAEGKAA